MLFTVNEFNTLNSKLYLYTDALVVVLVLSLVQVVGFEGVRGSSRKGEREGIRGRDETVTSNQM